MSEKYQCSRCESWVEDKDIDVYLFKSVHKHHTLLSIQMCLNCRDAVFHFIERETLEELIGCIVLRCNDTTPETGQLPKATKCK